MSETLIGLLHKSSSHSRPSQVAWAVVLGCICGVIPKTSLIFPVFLAVTFLLPIHFVAACICMLVTSCCTPLLHPLLGNFGHWLLQSDRIRQFAQDCDQYPLLPWFKLHNTVVMGSVFLSIGISWPAYWLVRQVLTVPYAGWLRMQYEVLQSKRLEPKPIEVREIVVSHSTDLPNNDPGYAQSNRPPLVAPHVAPRPLAAELSRMEAAVSSLSDYGRTNAQDSSVASSLAEAIDSIHALEDLLEKVSADSTNQLDADSVLARATKASELVDEILQSLDTLVAAEAAPETKTEISESPNLPAVPITVRIDAPQTFQAHDTTISIYRRARTGETLVSGSEQKTPSEKDPMLTANDATPEQSNLAVVEQPPAASSINRSNAVVSGAHLETNRRDVEMRHEEALRHLLSHLRALKEKV